MVSSAEQCANRENAKVMSLNDVYTVTVTPDKREQKFGDGSWMVWNDTTKRWTTR
jgi:hypothetical protein